MIRFSRLLFVLLFLAATPMFAQPFGAWMVTGARTPTAYVSVPHHPDFNFTSAFTIEAWVSVQDSGGCSSIVGKNWTTNIWIGVCGTQLRSYIKGIPTQYTIGTIPANNWTHIAVVYDGVNRFHFIDGELAGFRAESFSSLDTSTADFRIGSDAEYEFTPIGAIDEVRVWNVKRTLPQIRSTINVPITTPQTGLVAVYHLDGSGVDSIAGHNGSTVGATAFLTSPVTTACAPSAEFLCIESSRFAVNVEWMTTDGTRGTGKVVPGASAGSGLFWFFAPDNWELLVKVLNGCGLNNRKWAFSAATTNVHYELIVTDVKAGQTKRYFNYIGTPAPAVTDTGAFATCP